MKTTRFFIVLFVVSAVVFMRWKLFYNQTLTGIDDANIYFVYAQNLAEGNGLVYNAGGERVEGFTSFLWTMILTIFYLAGPMEVLTLFLNLFLITYTLYRLTQFADSLNHSSPGTSSPGTSRPGTSRPGTSRPGTSSMGTSMGLTGWLILFFICLIPGYLDWTILTHMETGLWSCLLVLITLHLLKLFQEPDHTFSKKALLVLMPLLVWTRPESIAWGLLFVAIRFGQVFYHSQSWQESFRKAIPLFASYFVPLILLIVFRLSYFGYPFPNTYYAKISSDLWENIIDGSYYHWRYVKENPFIPVFILLYLVSFIFIVNTLIRKKKWLFTVSLLQLTILCVVAVQFLIPFYTGGDHFYLSRFLQPLYPILLLGAFNGSFWHSHSKINMKRLSYTQTGLVMAGLVLLILGSTRFSLFQPSAILKEFEIAQYGRETGAKLNSLFEDCDQYPAIGTYLAGGLAYTYKGETIDLLGLNNTLIAHSPKEIKGGYKNHSGFNKAAFYQLMPDIVHIDFLNHINEASLNEYDSTDFQNQVYKFIFQDEEFRARYVPAIILAKEGNWYQAYVQEKYLKTLRDDHHKFYVFSRKKEQQQDQEEYLLNLGFVDSL